jgi:amidophosphoribosyltransferase
MCVMEYIYFARPDSDIEGCNVHSFRKLSGRLLYQEHPVDADIVVGVPDSSLSAAMGYAEASGIPYEMGLLKSKYVGRTFIQPKQELRDKGVKMKLSPVRSIVNGKRVILIDDSIVRGTTSRQIVRMLREAGATEVHVCIASPKYSYPCYYGVDTGTYEELIGASHTVEEIRDYIEADSLYYLSLESLYKASGRDMQTCQLCTACFNGDYPTNLYNYEEELKRHKTC